MEAKKKAEAYSEKPEHLKDVFEFDKKNMKDDGSNREINSQAREANKKKDDDIMDRFDAFAEGFM